MVLNAEALFVGIDMGGSGTRAVLANGSGEVLASGVGGPSGTRGDAAGRRTVERALEAALAFIAPRVGHQACVVHVGLRGLSMPGRKDAVLVYLSEQLPKAEVRIVSDAAVALWGGLAGREGVAVLAGTGSIALARADDGREARAGGYGYLVSDEGSAYWLGREAVMACLRALDGRDSSPLLRDLVCDATGKRRQPDIIAWLYDGEGHVEQVASLAPLVTQAAQAGDELALGIVETAAQALAGIGAAAVRQIWPDELPTDLPVVCCGGVWSAGVLRQSFEAAVSSRLERAVVCDPRLRPVGGAVLLAMGAEKQPIPEQVVTNLALS